MFMNKLKRILILGLIAILCFSVIPATVVYADPQPFTITGSDGNTYTPVKSDIVATGNAVVGEVVPTVYCLWVPKEITTLNIRAADTYDELKCSCNKGTTTSEKEKKFSHYRQTLIPRGALPINGTDTPVMESTSILQQLSLT